MCDFHQNDNICGKNRCYGNYCNKHKREHLVHNNFIIINNFTCKPSDYLKDDILFTINTIDKKKYKKSLKKGVLFDILTNKISKYKHYISNAESIILVQLHFKEKYKQRNSNLRGEGFIDRKSCNNNEDFFTYETVDEIDDKYFFSYKDDTNIIWFFDIRSLKKLIEMNQGNPYTMKAFDYITIYKVNKLIEYLNNNHISLDFKDEIKELKQDKKKLLKQKITDVFASIERLGFSINIEWFTSLHIIQLKKLYSYMEDIWNYRAQLTAVMKCQICPPNGIIFNKSQLEIRNINSRDNIREIILNDILKFNDAIDDSNKRNGYMYFLIGLGKVNPAVYDIHPWILSVD